jgi:hypothetical protein
VNIRTLLSLGLLVSFFLPWMKVGTTTMFGYDILLMPFKYELKRAGILLIFADLIIIVSVYNIIRDLLQIKKTIFPFMNEFILGLIEFILVVFFVIHLPMTCCAENYLFNMASQLYTHGGVISFGIYSIAILSILGIINQNGAKLKRLMNRKIEIKCKIII